MDLSIINADLHLHSPYAGGVSERMTPRAVAENAPLKGLQLLSTADILHEGWQNIIKSELKPTGDEAIFEATNGTKFILGAEVCSADRAHHLILFPSFSKVAEVKEKFKNYSTDLNKDGRPRLRLSAEQIAEVCAEAGCLIGFAHAFTPYFGLLATRFNSYKTAYGSQWKNVSFMELGLSADTNMADRISELHNLTFTSNSDAHSPWPNKLGREFNVLKVKEISFEEISKALWRKDGRKCVLNVKFNPLEGKYHKTRCRGCLIYFEPKTAQKLNWKCPKCKDQIKKGVDYRIDEELADLPAGKHPEHRPACVHTIPLSEIIALSMGIKSAWSEKVQIEWRKFIDKFGTEINALINVPIAELESINKDAAIYVEHFRNGKIQYIPGGAGEYGKLVRPGQQPKIEMFDDTQKTLGEF
ncbi:MAG: phosphotransferase [DPANN group archaeon]|nr:phosphotransferase [DPANN group archaeon]